MRDGRVGERLRGDDRPGAEARERILEDRAEDGLPVDRVDRLAAAMAKVLALPEVQQKLAATESELLTMPVPAFVRLLEQESTRWGPLVRDLGIRTE